MINRVVLTGRLTKDPELRYTQSGLAVASFTLAVNRPFSNQQGEREADFINCVVWRKPAESVANYLKKGSLAGVDGRLQTRNYEGQDGKRVYITEVLAESVQFLDSRNNQERASEGGESQTNTNSGQSGGNRTSGQNGANNSNQNNNYTRVNDDPFANQNGGIDISDDDLPF